MSATDDFFQNDNDLQNKDDEKERGHSGREDTRRILSLLQLLNTGEYTRDEIYTRLADYYPEPGDHSRRGARMFERDLGLLTDYGFEIDKHKGSRRPARYRLRRGSGPALPSSLNDDEVDILSLLHNLFTDPEASKKHPHTGALQLPPPSIRHNPFAAGILGLIRKLTETISSKQLNRFEQHTNRPSVHLNLLTVTDYLPHRLTLEIIERAILQRQQIKFDYTPLRSGVTPHLQVDPYYIFHLDGHFYLLGYSNITESFLEYRIDRIQQIEICPDMIQTIRQRPTVEFHYWIDNEIAQLGLSLRWLTQTPERIEAHIDAQGKEKLRVLVRATAYNPWRVAQQLLKYGDRVELVDPPELREQMRNTLKRMLSLYEK